MIIGTRKKSLLAGMVFYLTILLLLLLAALALAVRLEFLTPLDAFRLTVLGAYYGGSAIAILSLLFLILVGRNRRVSGTGRLLFTLVAGALLAGPVLYLKTTGGNVPPIHDITTDTANPPGFIVLQKERTAEENSLEYEGETVAAQQHAAYPRIRPLITGLPKDRAFATALAAAREMGWRIAFEDQKSGRIEASDRTLWFRFIDDVVIIVTPTEDGSRIDLRSVSRVGKSDLGANAARIEKFTALFEKMSAS